ncbi:prenyltransferase/squalene oxidase repeat-containing protein [Streptomyces roseifaciens]|uniref:prenyltransferase/squalene oxidase repeat-containing protein n=1 Tax=Streptomyces roseifaciens TaxID=1488406 RepID=UPI0013659D8D|nr:prenyltransferase/squalene oxidase repeat-containing protein [Streptomyces roseifaciens]
MTRTTAGGASGPDRPTARRIREAVGRLMAGLGDTGTCSDSYNTAFVSRVRDPDGSPRYPRALQWLQERQHPDGSWGGRIALPADRLTSTLAAVRALVDYAETTPPGPYDWVAGALKRGTGHLKSLAREWRAGPHEPIGFEFVVPELTRRLRAHGVDLPPQAWPDIHALRRDKIARMAAASAGSLSPSLSPSLRYCMEVAPDEAFAGVALTLQSPGGSVGCSPAATAALWQSTGDARALAYLDHLAHRSRDGGAPEVHPVEAFETGWSLYHLGRAGLLPPGAAQHLDALAGELDRRGWVGFSREFPAPEADTTAMTINLLSHLGVEAASRLGLLLRYEADDHFFHYPGERGASVSVNARLLEAFNHAPGMYGPQRRKLIRFLLESRAADGSWLDKWHMSPYYATAHVCFALGRSASAEGPLTRTHEWLLDTQHPNGSWGAGGGQPEETAYAILALDALAGSGLPLPARTSHLAHRYLVPHLDAGPDAFAELWLGKSLYTPTAVVQSAVIAAAHLTRLRLTTPRARGD